MNNKDLALRREVGDLRRLDILEYIENFINEHGYGPSIRDIMKGCDLTSTSSVAHHLAILRDMGKIDYQDRIARSVRIL